MRRVNRISLGKPLVNVEITAPRVSTSLWENFCDARIFCWSLKRQPPRIASERTYSSSAVEAERNSLERATGPRSSHIVFKYSGEAASSLKIVGTNGRSKLHRMSA